MNEKNIRDTADILVSSGLADHGWTYVNIDDFWQNKLGKIVPRVLSKTPFMKSRAEDAKREGVVPLSGNVVYTDDFRTDHLDYGWFSERGPATFAKTSAKGLVLTATGKTLDDESTPAFLCRWVRNNNYTIETVCDFEPTSGSAFAGLTAFQNEKRHYEIGKTLKDGKPVIEVRKTNKGKRETLAVVDAPKGAVSLRIAVHGHEITFAWSADGKKWISLAGVEDASILSTDHAGGFVASTIGPFVVSR